MMDKWPSQIIRTRSQQPRDSETEDEDTPVVDNGGAGKQGAEIEEGYIEESSILSGSDHSPATGDSHDNLQPHDLGNESVVPTTSPDVEPMKLSGLTVITKLNKRV